MSIGQEIAMHGHNLEIVSSEQDSGRSPGAKRIWCILTPVGGHWWKDSKNFVVYATFKPDQSLGVALPHLSQSWGHVPLLPPLPAPLCR